MRRQWSTTTDRRVELCCRDCGWQFWGHDAEGFRAARTAARGHARRYGHVVDMHGVRRWVVASPEVSA